MIFYVSHVSAVINGSLSPEQIEWDMSLGKGFQCDAVYWMTKGVTVVPFVSIAKPKPRDKLR